MIKNIIHAYVVTEMQRDVRVKNVRGKTDNMEGESLK
jgi:hypothetical protein